jgi:hypothetical protein
MSSLQALIRRRRGCIRRILDQPAEHDIGRMMIFRDLSFAAASLRHGH